MHVFRKWAFRKMTKRGRYFVVKSAILAMTLKNTCVFSNWLYIADFVVILRSNWPFGNAWLHKTCAFTVYVKAWRSSAVEKYAFLCCILRLGCKTHALLRCILRLGIARQVTKYAFLHCILKLGCKTHALLRCILRLGIARQWQSMHFYGVF